jgi:hypothetical protein
VSPIPPDIGSPDIHEFTELSDTHASQTVASNATITAAGSAQTVIPILVTRSDDQPPTAEVNAVPVKAIFLSPPFFYINLLRKA